MGIMMSAHIDVRIPADKLDALPMRYEGGDIRE
jgi:hypothetical protein